MKIVILDGYTENPGDLSWAGMEALGEVTVYGRTSYQESPLIAEPIRADNPLLKAKNCIITPHISWAPKESRQRIMDATVENVKVFLNGAPQNVVNK